MTLKELSVEYRAHARALDLRICQLQTALEYIQDDELVEVTPKSIRMRKRMLSAIDRKKAAKGK